eukprot:gene2226-2400_t
MWLLKLFFLSILFLNTTQNEYPECNKLTEYQYKCQQPYINPNTYQPENCQPNNTFQINCTVIKGVICGGDKNFTITETCSFSSGKNFFVALSLSLFFGFLGIDRIYLGYIGVGVIKMFTFGLFGVLYVYDFLFIGLQILRPSDGSNYIFGYNGPQVYRIQNQTSFTIY